MKIMDTSSGCFLCCNNSETSGLNNSNIDVECKYSMQQHLHNCKEYLEIEVEKSTEIGDNEKKILFCSPCSTSMETLAQINEKLITIKAELKHFCEIFLAQISTKRSEAECEILKQDIYANGYLSPKCELDYSESQNCDDEYLAFRENGLHNVAETLVPEPINIGAVRSEKLSFSKCLKVVAERLQVSSDGKILPDKSGRELRYCKRCDKYFKGRSAFLKHGKMHERKDALGDFRYKCETCGAEFKFLDNFNRHKISAHQIERPFKCPSCPKAFKFEVDLGRHKNAHVSDRNFKCEICGSAYRWLRNLRLHQKVAHQLKFERKKPPVKVKKVVENQTRTENGQRKRALSSNKIFQCEICGRHIKGFRAFKDHERLHTGERPFPCTLCEMNFRTKITLSIHQRTIHVEGYPFPCDQCDKMFKLRSELKGHCTTHHHTVENLLICHECGKTFKRRGDLNTHCSRVHSARKKCEYCVKTFPTIYDRNIHTKIIHTKELSFTCQTCGRSFHEKKKLKDHERTHTGEKPFECNICKKRFTSMTRIYGHRKEVHSDVFGPKVSKTKTVVVEPT